MPQTEKKKWSEMNSIERLELLEKTMNNEILFSVQLLMLYIKNLKEMEKDKVVATPELVEEGIQDRMLLLLTDLRNLLHFITKE